LYGSCLQMAQARDGHCVVDYATADQYGCAAPTCWSVCAVADIVGKPEGLPQMKECLN
jgi:hypothetical protein